MIKPTEKQSGAIGTCIDALKCLRDSNDIGSPSHFADSEMEVSKLDLPREDELELAERLNQLINCIQRLT